MRPISRRFMLLAPAAGAVCRPAFAASGALGLRTIAASRGLLYGSYLDMWEMRALADYAALAARECGVMVSARMDWDHLQPSAESHDFAAVDTDYDWARAHDMKFRGHALVWGERAPKWFAGLPNRAAAIAALEAHIGATCRHFAGRMQSWDVVNEAILVGSGRADKLRPHVFLDKIGPDYLDIAFRAARAADPVARLVYNDFGVEFGAPDQLEKRRVLLGLIDGFKERGTPIDAIGLQSHLSIAEMAQFDDKDFGYFLDELAARGLEVMLTELDCIDKGAPSDIAARDAAVAAAYRRYLDVALANRAVTTVINWGLSDRQSWIVSGDDLLARRADGLRPRPLPFDTDLHPKPAYRAIAEALRAAPPRAAPRG
ncbi:MAG TPA: endo-1,4-beta-xylanase [Stellaceae bacterium]|nr:endo-1,4-beta-xylanase [Stellaceae bacterium]